ncbi:MAG: rRNA maturation RNase YbeY [bacterium]
MVFDSNLSILNKTKGKLPRLPFVQLKNKILGDDYDLSLVFVSPRESHKINLQYRGKDNPTNVLSFPLSKTSGEIFLDQKTSAKDAPNFDMTPTKFLQFLVIHAMLHLKGYEHGSTMEKQEKKFLKIFSK